MRQQYIEYLRAVCTIFIIGAHTNGPFFDGRDVWSAIGVAGGIIDTTVRTGLPLFFMISGALLLSKEQCGIMEFYVRRFSRIIIPFVIYSAVYYVYKIVNSNEVNYGILDFAGKLIAEPQFYHLWFVYSIIGLYALTPFIARAAQAATPTQLWELMAVLLVIKAALLYLPYFGVRIGFDFFFANTWVVYYIGGYAISRTDALKHRRTFIAIAAIGFASTFLLRALSLSRGLFSQGANMYALAFGIFGIAVSITKFPPQNSIVQRINSLISSSSYEIYLVHALVLTWLHDDLIRMNLATQYPIRDTFVLTACVLIASFFVAYLSQKLITGPIVRLVERLAPAQRSAMVTRY